MNKKHRTGKQQYLQYVKIVNETVPLGKAESYVATFCLNI